VPLPSARFKAFPGVHTGGVPYLIESNGITVDKNNPSIIYSAVSDQQQLTSVAGCLR